MMSWNKAPNDRGAALILTLGWSAVLLALAGVVSSAVLQQVRPSDNAESSYQAWAAAEAGVDDARARLSADSEYWTYVEDFYKTPDTTSDFASNNRALWTWEDVPGSEEGGPEFTYYLDVSGAAEDGRIQVTSSGRAREGDSVVRTVDVLITKRLSTDYAYLSNSESFPHDLPGAYGQTALNDGESLTSPAVARELCSTGGNGEEPTYWYQWKPWPGNDAGGPKTASDIDNPDSIVYGLSHRNSYACLHSVVTTESSSDSSSGNEKGVKFYGPAHTNDVWYVDDKDLDAIDGVFNGEVTSSCPDSVCDPEARWIAESVFYKNIKPECPPSGEVGGGCSPNNFVPNELAESGKEKNRPWNPTYSPVLEMPSDKQLGELRSIAASGGCVFTGPTRIRMTTEGGAGKVYITSPDTIDVNNSFCEDVQKPFATSSASVHPTVKLDYAAMVSAGFNGVFYVEEYVPSSEDEEEIEEIEEEDPPTCLVKDGWSSQQNSNYPWVIPEDEQGINDLAIVGSSNPNRNSDNPDFWQSVKGLPDQTTVFKGKKSNDLNVLNTKDTAYADLGALESAESSPSKNDAYYVVADEDDKSAYPDLLVADEYLIYSYTRRGGGSWTLAPLEFDEWTDTPEEQCRNGHVYLEAPAEDGGYTGRYTIAADGDIVITDDIYENSASVRTYEPSGEGNAVWGVPDATSDNQLGLVPDRWLYIYKLDAQEKGGDQTGINSTLSNLLLNVAVLAKDKCLALQDYSSTPALGDIKVVGALAQNSRCRLTDGSSGYNGVFKIIYDDRYKRLGPPPFMPVLSQEPWQAKVWSETTVRRDFEAKQYVPSPTKPPKDSGSTLTWEEFLPEGGQLLYVRLLTGAGSVTANTDEGTVSYTPSGGADTAVIEFVVKTSEGLTVGQTITYGA